MQASKPSGGRWAAGVLCCLLAGAGTAAPGPEPGLSQLVSRTGATYALGKKPYPAGLREEWIQEGRVLARAPDGYFRRSKTLKGAADNRQYLPPIGNQGSEGSCVHWAGSYYTKTANMKRRNPALNVSAASNQCSPRFTYNLTNAGEDNGGWGHEPFEIAMRYGLASLAQKPYVAGQYSALPTIADFIEGLHRRTTNYVWVWQWNPTAAQINELKAWLDAGGVAVCGVYAENTFDAWNASKPPWTGPACTEYDINHMVTVCGYGPGYYLVANSWGTSFGSNGYIYVNASYFEKYFSDVMYPLEGSVAPVTSYARFQVQHARRSDIRSLWFSVNGTTVWSNAPTPKSGPKGTGSYYADTRAGWQVAVDLSAAPWGAANVVTAGCVDQVSATQGTITNFAVVHNGATYISGSPPMPIPDNNGAGALASVSFQIGGDSLAISPASTNLPAAASNGLRIAVAGNVAWAAAPGAHSAWVTVASGSGNGNGTATYNVASNTGTSARTGTVEVTGGGITCTHTVVQAAAGSVFTLGDAVDAPELGWTTAGSADWSYQSATTRDGLDAAQSGPIGHSQQSRLQTTVTGPGTLTFWWCVSSENHYDYLRFFLNGVEQSGAISGTATWQQKTVAVPAGTHTLQWRYTKDISVSAGSDCGWVDEVRWAPGGGAGPAPAVDFDGDAVSDLGVFRPADGRWNFLYSGGGSGSAAFGWSAVQPVPADYDGDGQTDLAVYHPASGNWYIRQSSGGDRTEAFGWSATIPLPGDYDGDGLADLAVFHRPTARWYFRYSSGGPDASVGFGWSAVLPVPADYDGDGVVDLAVYHPATGNWYVHESATGEVVAKQLGGGRALPVPADYDGDGAADVAVFTRATAQWQVAYSGGGSLAMAFGWSAVLPVPADYDGDGKADVAIYHPAGGKWYIRQSSNLETIVETLGGPGKNPVLLNSLIHSWFQLD